MDQLAELIIRLYHSSDDFFLLHGVTSCYAMKLVLSQLNLKDIPTVVHCYVRAVLATCISSVWEKSSFIIQFFTEISGQCPEISVKNWIMNELLHIIYHSKPTTDRKE